MVDDRFGSGILESVEEQVRTGRRVVLQLSAFFVGVVSAADEEVDVVLVDGELGGLHGSQRPVPVVEAIDESGPGESAGQLLAVDGPGGRGGTERAVLPVAWLIVDGPTLVVGTVERSVGRSGRHRVRADRAFGGEGCSVEVADEVLPARSSADRSRIEVHDHDPFGIRGVSVDGQREQVGAFPDAGGGVCGPER